MSALAIYKEIQAIALPEPRPRLPINIRPAAPGTSDIQFIDALQKQHSKMVGFLHLPTLEAKIKAGHVLLAEEIRDQKSEVSHQPASSALTSDLRPLTSGSPVGYCIARDQYFKRDDVGVIYQLNVAPMLRRHLVGAALVKATFERAAYGCKLFCCWCAQDIEANYFWESLGFVPLAFRTGSRGKGRIHIFWQRRVRENDVDTPYWFPAETKGGAIREDRLVLPIPPGTHWSDAKPLVLPGISPLLSHSRAPGEGGNPEMDAGSPPARGRRTRKAAPKVKPPDPKSIASGGLWFAPPPGAETAQPKPKREKPPKQKNDPKYVAAARELRDRWLEQINADPGMLLGAGKYDVSRQLIHHRGAEGTEVNRGPEMRLLDAA